MQLTDAGIRKKNRNINMNYSVLNSTMAAASNFDCIVKIIQLSNLNFKLQLSPFTANISLKKTPVKDRAGGVPLLPHVNHPSSADIVALVAKNLKLENDLVKIQNDYTETMNDLDRVG